MKAARYRKSVVYAVLLLPVLLLCGCIVVDDWGGYWDKGFVDSCVNQIVIGDMNEDNGNGNESKDVALRSLDLGKHTFLMIREHPQDKGGDMIRYDIRDGEYISYRLNDSRRDDFARDYPGSTVVITNETATIPVLDDDSAALLARIAGDDIYWTENSREPYNPTHRTDCIHKP